jgi:hypothetical protein
VCADYCIEETDGVHRSTLKRYFRISEVTSVTDIFIKLKYEAESLFNSYWLRS